MHSTLIALLATGVASVAAYTQPGASTWGPLLLPDLTHPVTQGEAFNVTWDPEDHDTKGVTVSLVLCRGPSSNCVPDQDAIATGIPASQKSFDWHVPCDLPVGTESTATGYGMLIIVDGTGEFQYSTQFSCNAGKSCSTSSFTPSNPSNLTSTITSGGSIIILPPTYQTGSASVPANATGSFFPTGTQSSQNSAYTSGSFSFGGGSTPSGTTLISGTITSAASTGGAATATNSAAGSAFTGGAAQLSWNAAGAVVAGAAALLAL